MTVSVIVITFNRLEFLRQCIGSIMRTTGGIDKELIVWDNHSVDGTVDFIKGLTKEFSFVQAVYSEKNIGVNAKSRGFEMARGDYIACLDDDVLELPEGWVQKMIGAFHAVPSLGYLALDVIQNEHTTGAKLSEDSYSEESYDNGITLQYGPVGGWCFMIPRRIYETVGKLRQMRNRVFFGEDGDYNIRCRLKGYRCAILKGVKCFHATGEYYNREYMDIFRRKMEDWNAPDHDLHKIKRVFHQVLHRLNKRRSNED